MKEKWEELQELMGEEKSITKKEFCLMVAVAFLYGMVLGIFFSPKKHIMIGSNNTTTACDEQKKNKKKKGKCCRNKNVEKMI
ncbi:MAG: hypothetical protein K2J95_07705 [Lachnospiraceae bacterium]|nr:hypothetical protein [Lachnospiraceae bacterium]